LQKFLKFCFNISEKKYEVRKKFKIKVIIGFIILNVIYYGLYFILIFRNYKIPGGHEEVDELAIISVTFGVIIGAFYSKSEMTEESNLNLS
jgi:hypothetical protein